MRVGEELRGSSASLRRAETLFRRQLVVDRHRLQLGALAGELLRHLRPRLLFFSTELVLAI
jgi:hypothetical protein